MVRASSHKFRSKKALDPFNDLACTAWLNPSPHRFRVELAPIFFFRLRVCENDIIMVKPVDLGEVDNYQILQTFKARNPPPYSESPPRK
jgi:hypothetical protein